MNKIVALSVVRLNSNKLNLNPKRLSFVPSMSRQFSDNSDDGKTGKAKLDALLQSMKMSGGSDQKTEADSKIKLAKPNYSNPIKRDREGKPKSHLPPTGELDDEMVNVTRDVASLNSNNKQRKKNETDLLLQLKQLTKETDQAKKQNEISGEDMTSFLNDMKVDKPLSKTKQKKVMGSERSDLSMEQVAFLQKRAKLRRQKESKDRLSSSIDLNSGIPLGIFTEPMVGSDDDTEILKTWRACSKRNLEILSKPPPRNAIEEMILQTKQGKLWHFPINNEQGQLLIY